MEESWGREELQEFECGKRGAERLLQEKLLRLLLHAWRLRSKDFNDNSTKGSSPWSSHSPALHRAFCSAAHSFSPSPPCIRHISLEEKKLFEPKSLVWNCQKLWQWLHFLHIIHNIYSVGCVIHLVILFKHQYVEYIFIDTFRHGDKCADEGPITYLVKPTTWYHWGKVIIVCIKQN